REGDDEGLASLPRCQEGDGQQGVVGVAQGAVAERLTATEYDEVAAAVPLGDQPGAVARGETPDRRRPGPQQCGARNPNPPHGRQGRDRAVATQVPVDEADEGGTRRSGGVEGR